MRLLNDAISLFNIMSISQAYERSDTKLPPDFHKNCFDTVVPVPVCEDGELAGVDFAIYLADEGQIDARDELDRRRLVGIVLATGDLEAVDAVLVHGLTSADMSSTTRCDSPDQDRKAESVLLTCPGPIMVPFQWLIMISSESSRP